MSNRGSIYAILFYIFRHRLYDFCSDNESPMATNDNATYPKRPL